MSTPSRVPVSADSDQVGDGALRQPVSLVVRGVTVVAVVVVALVAAVVSFAHMQQLAFKAGEGWRSYLIPVSIDGLVVAASMVLVTRRRNGLVGGWLAWGALAGGVLASLAANMADARPEITAMLVAGWPAVAFAVAFELLLQQRRADQVQLPDPAAVPQPALTPTNEPLPAATYQRVAPVPPPWAPPPLPQQPEAQSIDAGRVEMPVAPESDLEPTAAANPGPPLADPVPDPTPWKVPDPDRWPVPGDDDLVTRVRQVIEASTTAGTRPPGRRAIAKQLNASEHQVRVALELVGSTTGPALNGTSGGAQRAGAGQGGQ